MAGMRALTWTHVFRRRLERHHLVEPAPATRLLEVVGSVCGIHAQIAASAELSIGARVAGIGRRAKGGVCRVSAARRPGGPPGIGAGAPAGLLCFGPNRGNRVTFVRPDQWAGDLARGWTEIDGRVALAEVLRRYLSAYGPATTR